MLAVLALILAAHQGLTWDVPYPDTADRYRLYFRVPPGGAWTFSGCESPIFHYRLPDDLSQPDVTHVYPLKCLDFPAGTTVEFALRAWRSSDDMESGNSNVVAIDWPQVETLP